MEFDINWLAVLVATVAHQALGALWYGVLFRDTWLRGMGIEAEQIETQSRAPKMAFGAIASLVSVIALALLLTPFGEPQIGDGIAVGAVAGLGFITAATLMNGMYEGRKPVVSVLFGVYYTLGLMIAGAILAVWR